MGIPKQFAWLKLETGPRHLIQALAFYGLAEIVGRNHNAVIMGWAKKLGLEKQYRADEIPWCGLFMAIIMLLAGREPVKNPLWALNWNSFGVPVKVPMLGDVLTFVRNGGGHVGLYIAEDQMHYFVLGGNQGNRVSIVKIEKSRLAGCRRPQYINQPANVRSIRMDAAGELSTNEA